MQKVNVILFLFLLLSACKSDVKDVDTSLINITPTADNNRKSTELPEITFTEDTFNFGEIIEGEVITHTYNFENTGNGPLILNKVESSCGCTVAKDWSTEPYAPGEKGSITVQFDSNKKPGNITKSITVLCNTYPSPTVLKIEGKVIGPNK